MNVLFHTIRLISIIGSDRGPVGYHPPREKIATECPRCRVVQCRLLADRTVVGARTSGHRGARTLHSISTVTDTLYTLHATRCLGSYTVHGRTWHSPRRNALGGSVHRQPTLPCLVIARGIPQRGVIDNKHRHILLQRCYHFCGYVS